MSTPWPEPPNYYDTPSKGYKVMLQTPGFPVIYPEPSVSQVGQYLCLLEASPNAAETHRFYLQSLT